MSDEREKWHPKFPVRMTEDFIAGLDHALELVADEQRYPSSPGYAENNAPLHRCMARIEESQKNARAALAQAEPGDGAKIAERLKCLADSYASLQGDTVRGLRQPSAMPTPFEAGYDLACEEILHRLEHEEWDLTVDGGWAPEWSDTDRLNWLLPNIHPATWGMEFRGGYEWDGDAEYLSKWRAAIDAELRAAHEGQPNKGGVA